MIKEYLKDHILITDGAMGTYYSEIVGKATTFSEYANQTDPDVIGRIHQEYIRAGARLIRTNTFSANIHTMGMEREKVDELVKRGYEIAMNAVKGEQVYVAADMGPIPEDIHGEVGAASQGVLDEYLHTVDTFLSLGADIFVLETLSSTAHLAEIAKYIKSRNPKAFFWTQFATTHNGYTRKGISISRIAREVRDIQGIDACGFNCGAGPTHLYSMIKGMDFSKDIVSVLPNAGYPEIINERTIYTQNPEYFSEVMVNFTRLGIKIIGGCCGTTPLHIQRTAERLGDRPMQGLAQVVVESPTVSQVKAKENSFARKLKEGQFPIAVELDPPFDTGIEKVVEGAGVLKENGVDIVTISDSPLARVRVHSVMLAAKIKREIGIDTLPHITCRDKNIIALKSTLLAAHTEGIRSILAVTGDPIPSAERSEIKSVFNLNSMRLMELIREMNEEIFPQDPLLIGGALNLNTPNKDVEVSRMERKAAAGASFFFTQPIYDERTLEYLAGMKRRREVKILGGIMPMVSYRNAQFLDNEIPGIHIPEQYIKRFTPDMPREEAEEVGVELAVEIGRKLKGMVDGFYLVAPFNRVSMIAKVLHRLQSTERELK